MSREDSVPSEASSIIPISQAAPELTAKIPRKKLQDTKSQQSQEIDTTPAVPGEASGIVPKSGQDESEFTVKIPSKPSQDDSQSVAPGEASGVIASKGADDSEFTVKIPGEEKKKKVTKRKPSSDKMKREESVSSETSGVVPVSQEQTEMTAKIPLKKSDGSQQEPSGEVQLTIQTAAEQPEVTAKIPKKKKGTTAETQQEDLESDFTITQKKKSVDEPLGTILLCFEKLFYFEIKIIPWLSRFNVLAHMLNPILNIDI